MKSITSESNKHTVDRELAMERFSIEQWTERGSGSKTERVECAVHTDTNNWGKSDDHLEKFLNTL